MAKKNKAKKKSQNQKSSFLGGRNLVSKSVKAPVSRTKVVTNRGLNKSNEFRVTHSELILDVVAPGDESFDVVSMEINPGLPTAFPWLSGIAPRFESYRFAKLVFEYIPSVGTGTNGRILIAPDYDPNDDDTNEDKIVLSSYDDSKGFPPWKPTRVSCKSSNLNTRKGLLVRTGSVSERILHDALQLNVGYSGFTSEVTLGELWVHYTVIFKTPQLEPNILVIDHVGKNTPVTPTWLSTNPFKALASGVAGTAPVTTGRIKPYYGWDGGVYQKMQILEDPNGMVQMAVDATGTTLGSFNLPVLDPVSIAGSVFTLLSNVNTSTAGAWLAELFVPGGVGSDPAFTLDWPGWNGGLLDYVRVALTLFDPSVLALMGKETKVRKRKLNSKEMIKDKTVMFRQLRTQKPYKETKRAFEAVDKSVHYWIDGNVYYVACSDATLLVKVTIQLEKKTNLKLKSKTDFTAAYEIIKESSKKKELQDLIGSMSLEELLKVHEKLKKAEEKDEYYF